MHATPALHLDNGLSIYLVAFGGLLLVSVLLDDLAARVRVPGILMVLLLGLLIDNQVEVSFTLSSVFLLPSQSSRWASLSLSIRISIS